METDICVGLALGQEGDWMSAEEEELCLQALDELEDQYQIGINGKDSGPNTVQPVPLPVTVYTKDVQQPGLQVPYPKLEARAVSCESNTGSISADMKEDTEPNRPHPTIHENLVVPSNSGTKQFGASQQSDVPNGDSRKPDLLPCLNGAPVATNSSDTERNCNNTVATDGCKSSEADIIVAETPLEIYRGKYLKVTDLTAQAWCEQQLVYSFSVPREVLQTPAMAKGTDMHLAKELEVHDIQQVDVTTREDSWAVKVLNIFIALTELISGSQKIREMPIFGEPFGRGVFFSGIIDEIRWNKDEALELVEFKTRVRSKTLPSAAQKQTHRLQVSLYKHMFDNAVRGVLKKESLADHLGLDLDRPLSDSVRKHMEKLDLHTNNLSGIVDVTLEKFHFLPQISILTTEYTSQSDSATFASESYDFDEEWLQEKVDKSLQYWRGEREPVGVDIEEAWKCHRCLFEENCEWKQRQIAECIRNNSIKRAKIH